MYSLNTIQYIFVLRFQRDVIYNFIFLARSGNVDLCAKMADLHGIFYLTDFVRNKLYCGNISKASTLQRKTVINASEFAIDSIACLLTIFCLMASYIANVCKRYS